MIEEDCEDDGITEIFLEQEREQCLLGLLLPTLMLLLSLLKRLQVCNNMGLTYCVLSFKAPHFFIEVCTLLLSIVSI